MQSTKPNDSKPSSVTIGIALGYEPVQVDAISRRTFDKLFEDRIGSLWFARPNIYPFICRPVGDRIGSLGFAVDIYPFICIPFEDRIGSLGFAVIIYPFICVSRFVSIQGRPLTRHEDGPEYKRGSRMDGLKFQTYNLVQVNPKPVYL